MANTKIEWSDVVWNPTTGCNKVSQGCSKCYAEIMHKRLKGMGQEKYQRDFLEGAFPQPTALNEPYKWNKPKKVFVNSMSDLFHENIKFDYTDRVWRVMRETIHIYQILTKRSAIMKIYTNLSGFEVLPNVWLGVSIEDMRVIHRLAALKQSNSAIKFLSLEPLIGELPNMNLTGIDQVIVGGGSGGEKRPMQYEWVKDIQKQCDEQNVAFFFKQWGQVTNNPNKNDPTIDKKHPLHAKGGCLLDGQIYREFTKVVTI